MRKFLAFVFFISVFFGSSGQSPIDSLRSQLRSLEPDSKAYLNVITRLAKEYAETKADSALLLTKSALKLARKHERDSAQGQIFVARSTAWSFLAKYDSAMKYSFLALRKAEEYADTLAMIDAYNNIGIDHMYREEDDKAISYFQKVASLSKMSGDSLRWGHALNNLGMMQGYQGNYEEELKYYEKAGAIFEAIDELEGQANIALNIGTIYTELADYDKAEEYYKEALELFKQIDYSSGIQNAILSWAENVFRNREISKAKRLAIEALDIAHEYSLSQDVIYSYDLLERIALSEGDFKEAYSYEIKETELKEKLFTEEKARQIGELETKYETEKKETEIARLSLENKLKDSRFWAATIGAGLVILFLVIFFSLRHKKQRLEKEAQELQIDAMKKRFMELHSSPAELAVAVDFKELNQKLHTPLTEREFDALKLSLEGKTNSEISDALFISVSTVKFHLRNTYSKMGVGNRKEAFQYMLKTH